MIIGKALIVPPPPVKVDKVLNNNTWEVIKYVADKSKGPNYWAVGDCKQITMNGKVSDGLTLTNYTTWVFIIGFDHNKDYEGTGITFQGFKTTQNGGVDVAIVDTGYNSIKTSGQWFNMNNSYSNSGGWSSSHMRSAVIPLIKAAFPSDLQSVIKTSTIYTDNVGSGNSAESNVTATQDDIYLLAEYEVFGSISRANTYEASKQQQYAYYSAGNSKVKYKHNATASAATWWGRSPNPSSSNYFCAVSDSGDAGIVGAPLPLGIAPAFKV